MRAALYARVSTVDQQPENELAELRRYAEARGWTAQEYVYRGVSGAMDRRPGLDVRLHNVIRFAHATGWRTASEVLPLEWRHVGWTGRCVRLDSGTTKKGEVGRSR